MDRSRRLRRHALDDRRREVDAGECRHALAELLAQMTRAYLIDLAFGQIAELERPERHPDQPVDRKAEMAKRLGASEVVVSSDPEQMSAQVNRLDLIIDTVAAPHDLDAFTALLRRDGTLVLVGIPNEPHPSPGVFPLVLGRRAIAGSLIGGIAETQEMLDFCAEHGITADIELIPIQKINEAYDRLAKGDVKYRFVVDMASLRA